MYRYPFTEAMTTDRAGTTVGASLSCMRATHRGASVLASGSEAVVQDRHQISGNETGNEPIAKPDQATDEGDPVADKKLAKEREVSSHIFAALENEPVRREEDQDSEERPENETLHGRVEARQAGEDDLCEVIVDIGHRTLSSLPAVEHLSQLPSPVYRD